MDNFTTLVEFENKENYKDVLGNNTNITLGSNAHEPYKFLAYQQYIWLYAFYKNTLSEDLANYMRLFLPLAKIEVGEKTTVYKKYHASTTIGERMDAITERLLQISIHLKTIEAVLIDQSLANSATAAQIIFSGISNVLSVIPNMWTKIIGIIGNAAGAITQNKKNKAQAQTYATLTGDVGVLERESLLLKNEYVQLEAELQKQGRNLNAPAPAINIPNNPSSTGIIGYVQRATKLSESNSKNLLYILGGAGIVYFIRRKLAKNK